MRLELHTIPVKTSKPFDFVEFTDELQKIFYNSGINSGFVLVRSPHTTAAIICNESDPTVHQDMRENLKRLLPDDYDWKHSYEGTDNARAHQVTALLGQTHWVSIEGGQLKLGRWQSLLLVELFTARQRRVEVVIIGE